MTTENRCTAGRNEDSLIGKQRKGDVIFYQVVNKTCDKQRNTPVWWGWVSMKPTVSLSRETLCILSESLGSCRDHLDLTEGHPVHEVHSMWGMCDTALPSLIRPSPNLPPCCNQSFLSVFMTSSHQSFTGLNPSPTSLPPSLPPSSIQFLISQPICCRAYTWLNIIIWTMTTSRWHKIQICALSRREQSGICCWNLSLFFFFPNHSIYSTEVKKCSHFLVTTVYIGCKIHLWDLAEISAETNLA